jgi:SAM-dependent methyltransferase
MLEIHENIYGHLNRTKWIMNQVKREENGLEFGCGTGVMITAYFLQNNYLCEGIDLDEPCIKYGKNVFKSHGLNPGALMRTDLNLINDNTYDYIIASEVFEHIEASQIDDIIELLKLKLKPGGQLFVTVPNGYGWFEFEAFVYDRLKIGWVLEKLYLVKAIGTVKKLLGVKQNIYPSTIANSPHVRRFTWDSIQKLLTKHQFLITEKRGSVLFCGSFSSILFTGIKPIMSLSRILGKYFGSFSSGFYFTALLNKEKTS